MKGRQRGRNGGKPRPHQQGGHRNHNNYDPNMGRMRGNAQQLLDKYLALARDASSQGDRVMAENYFQHADHYYRVLNARFEGQQNNQRRFNGQQQPYDRQDRPFDGNEAQPGTFNDFNRADNPATTVPPPQPMLAVTQPVQPIAQPQAQPEGDSEIGLPPQLFGAGENFAAAPAASEPQQDAAQDAGQDGERQTRPRQSGRRRRAPRSAQQNATVESA